MRRWTRPLAGFALLSLTACLSDQTTLAPDGTAEVRGVASSYDGLPADTPIKDRYIVVFRDDVRDPSAEADALMRGRGGEIHFRYANAIKGFAATIPSAAIEAIKNSPKVAYIEQDAVITLAATQSGATWGIDRIDQRDLPLSGSYTYDADGSGVIAYIIDTGILFGHSEFGGRATFGYDALGGSGTDCNGHGTHVAGTVGGSTWGVAKNVQLIAVRVLDCGGSGTISGVVAGVNYVAATSTRPAVANMSLGGGASSSLDNAVAGAISSGVTIAVAAGNSNLNACNYSPARVATAITVGATTSTDARASFSNFGTCLDLFAPGNSIKSAWHTSTTATNTISGTSMASPHVAGAAALYLQGNPSATPSAVASALLAVTTPNKVTSAGTGSPNALLYTGVSTGGSAGSGSTSVPPTNLALTKAAAGKNSTKVTLNWTAGSASTFDIYYKTSGTFTLGASAWSSTTWSQNWRGTGLVTYRVCNAGSIECTSDQTIAVP